MMLEYSPLSEYLCGKLEAKLEAVRFSTYGNVWEEGILQTLAVTGWLRCFDTSTDHESSALRIEFTGLELFLITLLLRLRSPKAYH